MLNKVALIVAVTTLVSLCGVQGVLHAGKEGGHPSTTSVLSGKSPDGIQGLASPAEKADEATRRRVSEIYGKLPLSFIQNDGQIDKRVRYYEKGAGHATYFTKKGVYLSLVGSQRQEPGSKMVGDRQSTISKSETIKLFPLGGNKDPEIVAGGLQEGKVNYLIGNDPKKWKTNIPTYKAVVYKDIYKDIDMKFYGNNRQMEYDIIVKPGASPSRIQFLYEGIEDLRVNDNGDLEIVVGKDETETHTRPLLSEGILQSFPSNKRGSRGVSERTEKQPPESPFAKGNLRNDGSASTLARRLGEAKRTQQNGVSIGTENTRETKEGTIIQKKPYVYQDIGGKRVEIDGKFRVLSSGGEQSRTIRNSQLIYGFTVASYDKHYPLVIDPTLSYSTYLGGSSGDSGEDIAVDNSGNVYVTGYTSSSNFPTSSPMYGSNAGSDDAFVTKINAAGSSLVYSTYLGGSSGDYGKDIAVDNSGNVYITGYTSSSNFPTSSPMYGSNAGSDDAFVTKINAAGSSLVYSTYLGGSNGDYGNGIAVDTSENAYVTGYTQSSDFPTANAIYGSLSGSVDAFVTKINSAGNNLSYSTYLGGSDGLSYEFGGTFGGETYYDGEYGNGIAVDTSGNVYVTGYTYSSDFPMQSNIFGFVGGSYYDSYEGYDCCAWDDDGCLYECPYWWWYTDYYPDAFVTKINAAGSSLVYSTYLGGSNGDYGEDIAVDNDGNVYITGSTSSSNFPTSSPMYGSNAGSDDAFVTKINAAGSSLVYSTYLGGSSDDYGHGIALDTSGNAYVTGYTYSSDFPVTLALYESIAGWMDAFVTMINAAGNNLSYSTYLGGSNSDAGRGVAVDVNGNAYITGQTYSNDFPTYAAIYNAKSGDYDAFVSKIGAGSGLWMNILWPGSGFNAYTGQNTTVSVRFRDGYSPITGASVIVTPSNGDGVFSLYDDGSAPDASAGDGIYSAYWSPVNPGATTLNIEATYGENTITGSVSGNVVQTTGYCYTTVDYSWIDATGGTDTNIHGDDTYATIPIGFNFDFYGVTYTDVIVSSNGFITFGSTSGASDFGNVSIPNTDAPNNFAAPFWDDLHPGQSGAYVYYYSHGAAPNRKLTIEWYNVPHFSNVGGATFEVTLYEGSNNLIFQYQDVDFGNALYNNGASATVGVENAEGDVGTQYSDNSASISNNMAIKFTTSCPSTAVTLVSFKGEATENGNVTLTWETATEVNNAGFNIYRARSKDGNYKKINEEVIDPKGSEVSGSGYTYTDTPSASGTYYYKLEDVEYGGATAMHGPVKVRMRSGEREARRRR